MTRPVVMVVFGTRPEVVKLAPVIDRLRRAKPCEVRIVATGQHRQMLAQAMEAFGIRPDVSLDIMKENQSLFDVTLSALSEIRTLVEADPPDALVVQGDTTTAYCAALAAFYARIPVGHVEAGLRSGDRFNPYPEEVNRRGISAIAEWHFAPTVTAAARLREEGVGEDRIFVTGNTVVDALEDVLVRHRDRLPRRVGTLAFDDLRRDGSPLVLVTCHRRESFGEPLAAICRSIRRLVDSHPRAVVAYPVHPNPNVATAVRAALADHPRIHLLPSLDYLSFVSLMAESTLILTDSGGVQEEAPTLGKPVLVLRHTTERPEGIAAGVARLVGTDPDTIVREALALLSDERARAQMTAAASPYGDGLAGERIAGILAAALTRGFAVATDAAFNGA